MRLGFNLSQQCDAVKEWVHIEVGEGPSARNWNWDAKVRGHAIEGIKTNCNLQSARRPSNEILLSNALRMLKVGNARLYLWWPDCRLRKSRYRGLICLENHLRSHVVFAYLNQISFFYRSINFYIIRDGGRGFCKVANIYFIYFI